MIGTCDVCGEPIAKHNKSGVCSRTAGCRNESMVRWRVANPKASAQHQKDRNAEVRRRRAQGQVERVTKENHER